MNFFETVRNAMRTNGYAYRTEKTYMHWIRQYVRFISPTHPRDAGADGVKRFITHLAVDRHVSASTQTQALAALIFVYKLYGVDLGDLDIVRARKSVYLPTVLTHEEAMRLLEQLDGQYRIMGQLMYGAGLRLMEVLRLRVKDVDFDMQTITLRDTKSNRDRVTCLPASAIPALKLHLAKVKAQHTIDLASGRGEVELPNALDKKNPSAPFTWEWQYVFPASSFSTDNACPFGVSLVNKKEFKMSQVRSVTIPRCEMHEGYPGNAVTVRLHWICPVCGGERGEPYDTISYDGSRRLGVTGWRNACGHIDYYSDVQQEAVSNGLNTPNNACSRPASAVGMQSDSLVTAGG